MRGAEDDFGVPPYLGLNFGKQSAEFISGLHDRAEQSFGQAKRPDELLIIFARLCIDEPRRCRVGVFVRADARELVRKIFGDHQKPCDARKPSLHQVVGELIDGIEGLKLDARAFIQFFEGHFGVYRLDGLLGPAVAVGVAGAHFLFSFEEHIVDRPGVDRKALDLRMLCKRRPDARFHMGKERVDIPNEMPVLFLHAVGKAIDFLRFKLPLFFVADDVPAARSADVDRKKVFHVLCLPYRLILL